MNWYPNLIKLLTLKNTRSFVRTEETHRNLSDNEMISRKQTSTLKLPAQEQKALMFFVITCAFDQSTCTRQPNKYIIFCHTGLLRSRNSLAHTQTTTKQEITVTIVIFSKTWHEFFDETVYTLIEITEENFIVKNFILRLK